MAILEIYVVQSQNALNKRIDYICSQAKTSQPNFISTNGIADTLTTGLNCNCQTAYEQMLRTKHYFQKEDKVQGYHYIQSFRPGEVTPEQAHEIGIAFLEQSGIADDFEAVLSTHLDKAHLHNHIVVNSVSFVDGHKYRSTPKSFYQLRDLSDQLCRQAGLSVIEKPKEEAACKQQYAEWKATNAQHPTVRSMIREDIDIVLSQAAAIEELFALLQKRGYRIKLNPKRKYIAVCPPGGKKYIRLDSLGEDYTVPCLRKRITAGKDRIEYHKQALRKKRQQVRVRKKYQAPRGTLLPKPKAKKLHGIRALYWKYLYLLGKVPKRRVSRPVRGLLLDEVRKLNQYTKQFYFLRDNRLSSTQEIELYRQATENEIYVLTSRRAQVYRARRTAKTEKDKQALSEQAKMLTAQLRTLRQSKRMCERILTEAAPTIRVRLNQAEQQIQHERNERMARKQQREREEKQNERSL